MSIFLKSQPHVPEERKDSTAKIFHSFDLSQERRKSQTSQKSASRTTKVS